MKIDWNWWIHVAPTLPHDENGIAWVYISVGDVERQRRRKQAAAAMLLGMATDEDLEFFKETKDE